MYTPEQAEQFDIVIKALKPIGSGNLGWLSSQLGSKVHHTIFNIMHEEELIFCAYTALNSTVKLLKRGYEVDAAGGWNEYIAKQDEEKRLQLEKESEYEARAKAIHAKTLLEIDKVKKDLERSELETETLKKQLLKLETEIADSAKQTTLIEQQIEALQTGNKYWYLPYVFSGTAVLISAGALIIELCKYLKR